MQLSLQHAELLHPPSNNHVDYLHGEENQEGNHQCEQSGSLSESESENGVGEELSTHGRVSRDTSDQSTEDRTDTSSRSNQTSSSGTSSDHYEFGLA
jgi:hypothetical protein